MATMSGWRITRAGITFIVVTLLLVGLVIGGIYFVSQRGEQARQQEAAEIARQNLEEASEGPVVIAREEPDQEEAPLTTGTNEPAPSTLPETGPTGLAIVAGAALAFFAASYLVSRRALQRTEIRR